MIRILTFGVFDYFHIGHLRLFKQCKQHADYLIVAVQQEESVLKYKPDCKLLYSTEERVELLSEVKLIDEVCVYDTICEDTLAKIDFDILALGEDHHGKRFDDAIAWCDSHGKRVVRLKRTEGISSSAIKERISNDI